MKMNFWLLCGMMVSTALLAQQATNLPGTKTIEEPAPAPAATNAAGPGAETPSALGAAASTNAPAAKAAKKKSAKKKSPKKIGSKAAPRTAPVGRVELRTVPLVAGPAVVVANSVNVRAQARLHSEVIGRLTRGQPVTVIGEITLNNSAADEPSAWAKITLPPGTHAWVKSTYIDPTDKTVKATRLNLRAGPGENYSVLGSLEHGQTVKDLSAKGDWMEIEPPANAFAFVAAQFLKQEEAAAAAAPAARRDRRHPSAAPGRDRTPAGGTPGPDAAGSRPRSGNANEHRRRRHCAGPRDCRPGAAASAYYLARGLCPRNDQHPGPDLFRVGQPRERQGHRLPLHNLQRTRLAAIQGSARRSHGRGGPGRALGAHAGPDD